ncbi:hypothetical protein BDF19DRAFT_445558 [Syncephalis fuscata]|nr:hypothetical protein BDF19DRAFT_445558 [Syncephalis fuscata]
MLGLQIFMKVDIEPERGGSDNNGTFLAPTPAEAYDPMQNHLQQQNVNQAFPRLQLEERPAAQINDNANLLYLPGQVNSCAAQSSSNQNLQASPRYLVNNVLQPNRDPLVIGMLGRTPSYLCGRVRISWSASHSAGTEASPNGSLVFNSSCTPVKLKLHFHGQSYVYEVRSNGTPEQGSYRHKAHRFTIVDENFVIWNKDSAKGASNAHIRPVYNHETKRCTLLLPFQIRIPDAIPNSYKTKFGEVEYSLKAKLTYQTNNFFTSLKANSKRDVTIRRWADFGQSENNVSTVFPRLGYACNIQIPRSYYASGDTAQIDVFVGPGLTDLLTPESNSNNGKTQAISGLATSSAAEPSVKLKRISVQLTRQERSSGFIGNKKKTTITKVDFNAPPYNPITKAYNGTIFFPIPRIDAPSLQAHKFTVEYILKVKLVMRGKSDTKAKFPITALSVTRDEQFMPPDTQYGLPLHIRNTGNQSSDGSSNSQLALPPAQQPHSQGWDQSYVEPPPPYSCG